MTVLCWLGCHNKNTIDLGGLNKRNVFLIIVQAWKSKVRWWREARAWTLWYLFLQRLILWDQGLSLMTSFNPPLFFTPDETSWELGLQHANLLEAQTFTLQQWLSPNCIGHTNWKVYRVSVVALLVLMGVLLMYHHH